MKPILSIETKTLPEMLRMEQKEYTEKEYKEKKYIENRVDSLCDFNNDYILLRGIIPYESILVNQHYIDTLFIVLDYLYQYYDFSPRHFELLELAAGNLERLHQEQLAKLRPKAPKSTVGNLLNKLALIFRVPPQSQKAGNEIPRDDDQQLGDESGQVDTVKIEEDQIKTDLSDYLDKVALIFQTASDKAESESEREHYGIKAKEYSAKADKARGITSTKSHIEKMLGLYEKAAVKYAGGYFIKTLFQQRVEECRERLQAEQYSASPAAISRTAFSSSSSMRFLGGSQKTRSKESPENTPLLAEVAEEEEEEEEGLRRRKITQPTYPNNR